MTIHKCDQQHCEFTSQETMPIRLEGFYPHNAPRICLPEKFIARQFCSRECFVKWMKWALELDELRAKLEQEVAVAVDNYGIAIEELTKEQVCKAFMQAIECGDFKRFVTQDERQCVIYIPFQREQEMQREIDHLKELMKQHGIDPSRPYLEIR